MSRPSSDATSIGLHRQMQPFLIVNALIVPISLAGFGMRTSGGNEGFYVLMMFGFSLSCFSLMVGLWLTLKFIHIEDMVKTKEKSLESMTEALWPFYISVVGTCLLGLLFFLWAVPVGSPSRWEYWVATCTVTVASLASFTRIHQIGQEAMGSFGTGGTFLGISSQDS